MSGSARSAKTCTVVGGSGAKASRRYADRVLALRDGRLTRYEPDLAYALPPRGEGAVASP